MVQSNFIKKSIVSLIDELINGNNYPADVIFRNYCKSKSIGSKNRKELSDLFFGFIRNYWFCKWVSDNSDDVEKLFDIFLGNAENRNLDNIPDFAKANMDPQIWSEFKNSFKDENEARMECSEMSKEAFTDLRINTFAHYTKSFVIRDLCLKGIVCDDLPFCDGLRLNSRIDFYRNDLYKSGAFEIQDFGSQIISKVANIFKPKSVLDYCAGAGGKSLAILNGNNKIEKIVLTDINSKRLNNAEKRFSRIDDFQTKKSFFENKINKKIFFSNIKDINCNFELVLVDAPCSGIGTLKRNPWITIDLSVEKIKGIVSEQLLILNESSKFVQKDGYLIYITCSLLNAENQNVIENFLKINENFSVIDIESVINFDISNKLLNQLKKTTPFLLLPPSLHKTDGFFVAILKNVGNKSYI